MIPCPSKLLPLELLKGDSIDKLTGEGVYSVLGLSLYMISKSQESGIRNRGALPEAHNKAETETDLLRI